MIYEFPEEPEVYLDSRRVHENIAFFAALREQYPVGYFENRRVDLEHNDVVVEAFLVNLARGPIVQMTTDGRGYGLFADKQYKKGEKITVYGGEEVPEDQEGDYVLFNNRRDVTIDAKFRFFGKEKGRWINDAKKSNVEINASLDVFATKKIQEGQEILWWYGPDYERTW